VGRDHDALLARIGPVAGDQFHLFENERLELRMERDLGFVDDESLYCIVVNRGEQRNELGDPARLEPGVIASVAGHGGEEHPEPPLTPLKIDSPIKKLLQPRFDLDPQIRALIEIHHVAHYALNVVPLGTIIYVSVKRLACI